MRRATNLVFLIATVSIAWSDDITTSGGKAFKNAEVIQFTGEGLTIKHDGGTNQLVWQELPATVRLRYQAEARKRKEQEIEKLKQDLARAEAEAAKLGSGTAENTSPPVAKAGKTSAPDEAAKPIAGLALLKAGDVVDAADLVLQFKADSAAANQRYRKKTFRVRGVVERFEPKMFVRKYDVLLASTEKFVRLVVGFDYPDNLKAVYTIQHGQKLVGKPTDHSEVTLLKVGDPVVFEGKCQGLSDSEIVFSGCRLVR